MVTHPHHHVELHQDELVNNLLVHQDIIVTKFETPQSYDNLNSIVSANQQS